ncbi:discoidin domain-containing receptor 2-like isoform X3 [Saccostrea echinata]|uniref:discoidin domain-containing receptor 2-like isoform X3 n=1 Tax=Saccostrea echinata TaxID=191078 RepID=UPI002A819CF0|nr:discoidin domain-containing receptor 2-like isoform X3 [Saccostrea echinata]
MGNSQNWVKLKVSWETGQWIICLLWMGFYQVHALELGQCQKALGMESGEIPDHAITASSSFKESSVGPESARIRKERKGGAWCPKEMIDKFSYEYLQIDLDKLMVITKVETQGRFGNGLGQEYTEEFLLEYQREDDGEWIRFRNRKAEEHFKANYNTHTAEMNEVSPPIIAKRVRFIPYSQTQRTVCMRVELYGCTWDDGVLSYSMPQGHRRGKHSSDELAFLDFTYDGIIKDQHLYNGIGQLMDGEEGQANFRNDIQARGIKGYEWVGWKTEKFEDSTPIEIVFKFDAVRNFTRLNIHCNNFYDKDVRIFRMAHVYFSVSGIYYQPNYIEFKFERDSWMEYARTVPIPLENRVGKYVKVQLFFDSKWMLISEVSFISEITKANVTMELPPVTHPMKTTRIPPSHNDIPVDNGINVQIGKAGSKHVEDRSVQTKEATTENDMIGIIVGTLSALIVTLLVVAVIVIILIRHKRSKQNNNRHCLKPVERHIALNMNSIRNMQNGKVSNGNMYNSVAQDELESDREICNGGEKLYSRDYAVPDVTKSALIVALPPHTQTPIRVSPANNGTPIMMTNSLSEKPPTYDALYAAADIVHVNVPNIPNLQGVSGNNVYAVPNAELLLTLEHAVVQFPRENLQFVDVLGEGQFGEVHLCEAVNVDGYISDEYFMNRASTHTPNVLVAVKMLRRNADDRARADFHKEIKIMSQLKDPNIVRVLGVCTREEPLCMIVEYMKYGDLNQFLLDHVPESPVAQATNAKTLSYGCLVYMASQIASGMKYLESLNMVHRDLATRNCLVGTNYTIKISDFGMSRSLYSADYYRIEGRAVLPIRWMAWESILLGKFTTKSDVWSFAVTLWEILTFAKDQPFDSLTDEQVIENAGHYYRNDNKEVYLSFPPNCPKEIFDLMVECWNRNEACRPTFREVHMFLQRKNMGYNPKDEKMNQIKVPIC